MDLVLGPLEGCSGSVVELSTVVVFADEQVDGPPPILLADGVDARLAAGEWSPNGVRIERADDLPWFAGGIRMDAELTSFHEFEHEPLVFSYDELVPIDDVEGWLLGCLMCQQDFVPADIRDCIGVGHYVLLLEWSNRHNYQSMTETRAPFAVPSFSHRQSAS